MEVHPFEKKGGGELHSVDHKMTSVCGSDVVAKQAIFGSIRPGK